MACTYGPIARSFERSPSFCLNLRDRAKVVRILIYRIRYYSTKKLGGHRISNQMALAWEIASGLASGGQNTVALEVYAFS